MAMSKVDEIVSLIRTNRISTTEVADALGKQGVLPKIGPMSPDIHRVGPIRVLFAANGSNHLVHRGLPSLQPGEVGVVFTDGCEDHAIFGDLVSKYAILYCQAEAMVIDGLVRDAARIRRERYPVWSSGVTPLGCTNVFLGEFPEEKARRLTEQYSGGVAVCDDGGVVLVAAQNCTDELIERLHRIELQEDCWYFCLDTLKWSTYDIVCERKYLGSPDILPPVYRSAMKSLSRKFDPMP